jgi:sugar-specific transcriptional regulator TrmB
MEYDVLQKSLLQIGLSNDQVEVYLLILDNKKISISVICSESGFNRMKVYKILDELKQEGLLEFKKDYKSGIQINPPAGIVAKLRTNERQSKRLANNLTEIMPQLLGSFFNDNHSICRIFRGKYQLVDLFDEMLDETTVGDVILNTGEGEDFNDLVGKEYILEWMRKRVKKGVILKTLIKKGNKLMISRMSKNKKELRESRILPFEDHDFNGLFSCYGNKLILWDTVLHEAVVVENQNIHDSFKNLFEKLWQIGSDLV